ncbi:MULTISPECIES: hypothetical protein [unclassified Lactococcus]|uniref:hypothetical protein n=1 Tax=unclassified Lactococcus TaxID=2643510 RepID=UPI00143017B5|nr:MULTISPECIES: hypothetical protein [unclassified Lactococcus]KAF6606120.1 hypothetical protein HFD74_12620 [Lactococcus sp. EKM201L]KAF6611447.1 hypothetical protein HFD15_12810 [Lactococcus sp. EKM203L]KAF6639998.1 hypothetical protein HFC73_12815 [Lactococcus sp. EKM501L]KAF6641859.1 hypothetical protein HFC72_12660 [Lactococcus sp. EKM502L]KAF6651023.1 hypothetical protein HFC74_11830 [Lactococcus sp. EKM101L]
MTRRRKAEITSVYGGDGTKIDSYVSHDGYVNIPRFKHKKKPISMIKALNVRDSINYRKNLWAIQERSNKNTMLLSETGGGDMGKLTSTNLETGEKRWI